ncbi:MAG TPA: redoxin family protein [Terriglobia bacterium]|nr:redoxin family protein [Terriglobia bacterium]
MSRSIKSVVFLLSLCLILPLAQRGQAPESTDVTQALAQGDAFLSHHNFAKAREAYLKADKLSHHTCPECFLRMARADRQAGDLGAALDDAKRAVKAAGDDKAAAARAHMARGVLLTQMAGKPTDKKLREAEDELRQALALDPNQAVAHFNLGEVLIRQERDNDGILELKNYIAAPGADPRTLKEARRVIADPIRAREPFAPDFAFTSLEGETVSNAVLRGKVVLLDFWGTWCGPCRESVPMLVDIRKKYLDRPFQMVGISSDDDQQAWKNFIASHRMDWPEYIDLSGEVRRAFTVDSYPTLIVLDRDGVIRFRQSGLMAGLSEEELEEAIGKALKRPSQSPAASAAAVPESATPTPTDSGATAGMQPTPTAEGPKLERATETDSSAGTSDEESGAVSGNVYRNQFLRFSYQFPTGWVAAQPETLHAANEKNEASAKAMALQQHPESGGSPRIAVPKNIFYASQRGQGDGQRLSLPCVRISATTWNGPDLTLDSVKSSSEKMQPPGISLVRGPEPYTAGDQKLFRADYESTGNGQHLCMSRLQTVADGYLLMLEFFAADRQELEQLVSSASTVSFEAP